MCSLMPPTTATCLRPQQQLLPADSVLLLPRAVLLPSCRYGLILLGNPRVLSRQPLWNALLTHFKEHVSTRHGAPLWPSIALTLEFVSDSHGRFLDLLNFLLTTLQSRCNNQLHK